TGREIVQGQWLALKRLFLWPVYLLLGVQLFVFALDSNSHSSSNSYSWFQFTLGFHNGGPVYTLYHIATAVAHMFALGWVGMWLALSAKKPNLAAAMTFLL